MSHEIELGKIRSAVEIEKPKNLVTSNPQNNEKSKTLAPKQLNEMIPKLKIVNKPIRDFFGRVVSPPKSNKENSIDLPNNNANIIYKYNEGYSNAVRKPIYMRDLLK